MCSWWARVGSRAVSSPVARRGRARGSRRAPCWRSPPTSSNRSDDEGDVRQASLRVSHRSYPERDDTRNDGRGGRFALCGSEARREPRRSDRRRSGRRARVKTFVKSSRDRFRNRFADSSNAEIGIRGLTQRQRFSAENPQRLVMYRTSLLPSGGFRHALPALASTARRAVRIDTRAMSSSVNPVDARPLVNSESLPSVNPMNLLGASSPFSPFGRIMRTRVGKKSLVTHLLPTAPAHARFDDARRDRRAHVSNERDPSMQTPSTSLSSPSQCSSVCSWS